MSITNQTDFFLNFQQFNELKVQARNHSDTAATAVAQQFEGLFVQQMLAAMRSASKINGGQDSSYMDFYQEMYDKQLAQTVAGKERSRSRQADLATYAWQQNWRGRNSRATRYSCWLRF